MLHFPASNGYIYILLVMDYISKWVKVNVTKANDYKVVVDSIKSNIFTRLRTPKAIISNNGLHSSIKSRKIEVSNTSQVYP